MENNLLKILNILNSNYQNKDNLELNNMINEIIKTINPEIIKEYNSKYNGFY